MPNTLILCAMEMEKAAAPPGATVVVSGPGFRAALHAAEHALASSTPDLVLNIGTCGALRDGISLGDVFSPHLLGLDTYTLPGLPPAVLVSQDRVAVTRADKAALAALGADLVDMEALPVARLCLDRGIPFAAAKAVSDLSTEDLPLDFNFYRRRDGTFDQPRIAFAGIMKIRGLLRLQRQSRLAVEKLGDALAHAL